MAVEIGQAYVSITASAKGIGKSLQDEVEGPISASAADAGDKAGGKFKDSFGGHLKGLAAAAGGAFAGLAAGAFLKDSISAASDLNESLSKVNVVFGESAPVIESWSKSAAESLGQSQQQALEAAGTFGNLFRAMGIGTPVAADMSQKIIGLAGDLASFNNANPEDVLVALKSGLVGETEPLRAFGVNLNDARIKAEALSLGLAKSSVDTGKLSAAQEAAEKATRKVGEATKQYGADSQQAKDAIRDSEQANAKLAEVMEGKMPASLDAATKAQAAYSLIMKDTTLAQGDFARTSDGLANRQRILSAKFADLKASLGTQLLPVVNAVGGFLLEKVVPAFQALASALSGEGITSDGFVGVMEHIGVAIRGVVTAVVDHWPQITATISGVIGGIKSAIGFIVPVINFFRDNWELVAGIVVGALAAIAKFLITTYIPKLVAWAASTWATVAAQWALYAPFIATGLAIAAFVAAVIWAYKNVGWFHDAVDAVGRFLRDTLWPIIQDVAGAIVSFAQSVISALGSFAGWFNTNVVPVLKAGWELISAAVTAAWGVFQTMLAIVTPILSTLLQIAGSVFEQVKGVIETFVAVVGPIFSGLFDGMLTVASTVMGVIKDVIDGILGVIRGIFEAITGLIKGDWGQFWEGIQTVASSVFGAAKDIISGVWDGIKSLFQTSIDTVKTTVSNGIDAVVGFISGLPGRVADSVSGAFDGITEAFRGAINGVIDIWNGLQFSVPGFSAFGHEIGGFTIGVPNLPHLASGGLITRAGAALVGENGPEVVTLPAGAGVIPNNRIGPPINLSFYNSQITARQAMEEAAWLLKTGGR